MPRTFGQGAAAVGVRFGHGGILDSAESLRRQRKKTLRLETTKTELLPRDGSRGTRLTSLGKRRACRFFSGWSFIGARLILVKFAFAFDIPHNIVIGR